MPFGLERCKCFWKVVIILGKDNEQHKEKTVRVSSSDKKLFWSNGIEINLIAVVGEQITLCRNKKNVK